MKIDFSKVQKSIDKISALMRVADFRENNKKETSPEDDSIEGLGNKLENIKDLMGDVKLADSLVDEAEVLKKEFCKSIDDAFYIEKKEHKKKRDSAGDFIQGIQLFLLGLLINLGIEFVSSKFFEIPSLIFLIPALMALGGICVSTSAFCFCLANEYRKNKSEEYQIPFYQRIYIGVFALVLAVSLWTTIEGFTETAKNYLGF